MLRKPFDILIVDDDKMIHETAVYEFSHEICPDLKIHSAYSGEEAIDLIMADPFKFAVILLDFQMGSGLDGADTAVEILKVNPDQTIITFSGDDTRAALKKTFKSGVVEFLEKTIPSDEKIAIIRRYCRLYKETFETTPIGTLPRKSQRMLNDLNMVGQSKEIIKVATDTLLFAQYDSNVLVRGETGTGKELIAKAIHENSRRAHRPFIAINCGSIPENLIESELFGHAKGSFTGAIKDRQGKFQDAEGGTIFLDEIGDMPLPVQVKLLRVLQEGTIEPIGKMPIKVNVRIIAATHVNLETKIERGRFREDLYFRLNVLKICVPPLRERKEDIKLLIKYFIKKFNPDKDISDGAIRKLEKFNWPGNIRQLKNMAERLCVFSKEKYVITPELIRYEDMQAMNPNFSDLAILEEDLNSIDDLNIKIATLEKSFWTNQIKEMPNIVQLAKQSNISKATLYRKLSTLGIDYKVIQ